MKREQKTIGLFVLVTLVCASGFIILSFSGETFDAGALIAGGILCLMLGVHYVFAAKLLPHTDRHLLIIAYVLTSIGMIMQYRINPDIASKQLVWVAFGMAANLAVMLLMRFLGLWRKLTYLIMGVSLVLLTLALLLGKSSGGAYNWINIGGFSFQPSEYVKIALIFVMAEQLSRKNSLVRLMPAALFLAACLGILVISRDLGAAAIYALTALAMYYIATGNTIVTFAATGAGVVGAIASYQLFDHVRARVAAWQNPWASYLTNGYQIAQGLMAIASGGLLGLGLGRGAPKLIPAYHTDYIFAVICEEMGIIVGVLIIALYAVFLLRGLGAAKYARDSYTALIAAGVTVSLGTQTFLILGGVIKLIPLTGVTLPFVSYGGSSLMASYIMLGILEAISQFNGEALEREAS